MHEYRFHDESSFITLTYSDDKLPPGGSLRPPDFQKFMKRLRKECGKKIRFFHCGEYGEKFARPHYHAIIFGESFRKDAFHQRKTRQGHLVWRSPMLEKLWPSGISEVGEVTFESCAYVARYVTKKVNGNQAKLHYSIWDEHGELHELVPEYATMSRRPGIGHMHFEKYAQEIYPRDEIIVRGKQCKPPKFYDKLLERYKPELYMNLKESREIALTSSPIEERSPQRLAIREEVKRAQIRSLARNLENAD